MADAPMPSSSSSTTAAEPTPAPDLESYAGLASLPRVLRPLAIACDTARAEEFVSWMRLQQARQVDDGLPTHSLIEYRLSLRAKEKALRAQRALTDGVVRLLVRGHALDCACSICRLEQRLLEPLPTFQASPPGQASGVAPKGSKSTRESKARPSRRKGGRRHA